MKELLYRAEEPGFFEQVRFRSDYAAVRAYLDEEYEKWCTGEVRTNRYSEFILFSTTGDRSVYQENFFHRQHRMLTLGLMAMIYADREDYLIQLCDAIWDECNQYVWALPAHIDNVQKYDPCQLDLDATSMAFAMCIIKRVLGDRLPELIRTRIHEEIRVRVIEPFLRQRWHWEFRENNWTSVCAGSVGCTVMLEFPELFEELEPRFDENMRGYLNGFRDDGVCSEGPGYWFYGFSYFMSYADMVYRFTDGRINYFEDTKAKEVATFFEKITLSKNTVANFGDCGANAVIAPGFLYILKTWFPHVSIPAAERMEFMIHYFPTMLYTLTYFNPNWGGGTVEPAEYYMQYTGWYTKRAPKYSLAARGGSNGESHNHNDVGSFIFVADDRQVLCDIGNGMYTRQFFEMDKRYKFLCASSRGHNVPFINGREQGNPKDSHSVTSFDGTTFEIEFHKPYDIPELTELTRRITCLEDSVHMEDSAVYEGEVQITERFVTLAEPRIEGNTVLLDGARIVFDPAVAEASYHTEKKDGTDVDVYLIDLAVKPGVDTFAWDVILD